jgi:5-methylcytosine-specific restriction endonuclease McrA
MTNALHREVWQRARAISEYCRMPQFADPLPFQIDHIIAQQHGGRSVSANLALACMSCNRNKGPNVAGIDPRSGRLTRLFDPRRDNWTRHFHCRGPIVVGRTAIWSDDNNGFEDQSRR